MCTYSGILLKVKYVKIKKRMLPDFMPVCPKKVFQFDKSSNNNLLFYCSKSFRFYLFIHRLRFWNLNLSNPIKTLRDIVTYKWSLVLWELRNFRVISFARRQVVANWHLWALGRRISILFHFLVGEVCGDYLVSIFNALVSGSCWNNVKMTYSDVIS